MRIHSHWLTRRRIEQLFVDGLPPARHEALLRELRTCESCAHEYRHYQRLEAALCASDDEPTPFAIERLESLVVHAACNKSTASTGKASALAPALSLSITAACLALVATSRVDRPDLTLRSSASSVERLATRGGDATRSDIGIRTFRVIDDGDRVEESATLGREDIVERLATRGGDATRSDIGIRMFRVIDDGDRVEESATLGREDIVTFSYTNIRPDLRYLALLGIQSSEGVRSDGLARRAEPIGHATTSSPREGARIRWYYPALDSDEPHSIPIQSDKVDEPLGDGFKLNVYHTCGWLRVTALFSANRIGRAELQRAVDQLASPVDAVGRFAPLPLEDQDVVEHSIRVRIRCP